jgi:hypothetical protein
MVILVAMLAAVHAQSSRRQLDPRIGPPVPSKYDAVRDAKDWLNPYLQVCADGVELTAHSVKHKSTVAVRDLSDALVRLRAEAWPYGRIVALQECSIGIPEDAVVRQQRLVEVRNVLEALELQVSLWPA